MTSLDTNVVLRYLLNDIPTQTAKASSVITNSAVYVTDVVLTEVIFVLERVVEINRSDIVLLVQTFLDLPTVVYNEYFLDQTITMFNTHPSLSFVDCYAAVEAATYKNQLITFDKALAKHGGSHVSELA